MYPPPSLQFRDGTITENGRQVLHAHSRSCSLVSLQVEYTDHDREISKRCCGPWPQ
ncbi:hypothetical protein [Stenotrophomonas phage CM2]